MSANISRHGITWTISESVANGTYVNGDPWTLPCNVIAIFPPTSGGGANLTSNGSMINPSSETDWAFDGRIDVNSSDPYGRGPDFYHVESLNVANNLPLSLTANQSLVSVESWKPGQAVPPGGSTNIVPLLNAAILTCVDTEPSANAFRPNWWGNTKVQWSTDDIVQELPMLTQPVAYTSGGWWNTVVKLKDGRTPLFHATGGGGAPAIHCWQPENSINWYPGTNARELGSMALTCCFDLGGYEIDLRNYLIQIGIDLWAVINRTGSQSRMNYGAGYGPGRWFPIAFAGWMLGDNDMLYCCDGDPGYTASRGPAGWFWEQDSSHWLVPEAGVWKDYRTPKPRSSYQNTANGFPLFGDSDTDGLFPGNHSRRDPYMEFDGCKYGTNTYPYSDAENTTNNNGAAYMTISCKNLPCIWMAFQLLGMPRDAWPSEASWLFAQRWCNDPGMWSNFRTDFDYSSTHSYYMDIYGFGGTGSSFAYQVYNTFFKSKMKAVVF